MVLYTASLKYINKNIQLVSRKMWEIIDYVLSFSPDPTMNYKTIVSFIPFFVFGHFGQQSYENTKILCNLCLHFARQDEQGGKKSLATKVTKNQKIKIWDEQNK